MAYDKGAVESVLKQVKAEGRTSLTAPEAKTVCDAYGIPLPKEGLANSPSEAAKLADGIGYPVVMKIVSADILHKTEAGGVKVGVANADAAAAAYDEILANAKTYNAEAELKGVQVQEMLPSGAQEVIVGAVTDPSFGKLVAFGLGGILVEVLKDITFRLAPATQAQARTMLEGIEAAEVLNGVRGAAAVDKDASGRQGRHRQDHRRRFEPDRRFPGDPGNGPQPGVRDGQRHHRGRCPDIGRFLGPKGDLSADRGRNPWHNEADIPSQIGGGHRGFGRGRQDRQFGDEEPDQRWLRG
jgi:hypothetical protein